MHAPTHPSSRRTAVAAGLLALVSALLVPALVAPAPAGATTLSGDTLPAGAVRPTRLAGRDRIATAATIATDAFTTAPTAVVARADRFPDALAGAYLAGVVGGPVLLTNPTTVPSATRQALADLGVDQVVLLGGVGAISESVEHDLARSYRVTRIAGTDRFHTAADIARWGGEVGTAADQRPGHTGTLRTAIVATGLAFPDALAAGPLANAGHHPILLTLPDRLPDQTRAALTDPNLHVEQVVLAGGTGAVSAGVEQQLEDLGLVVTRVAGTTRTATAARLATLTRTLRGWDDHEIDVARADDFPDALALAPHAGANQAVVVLAARPASLGKEAFRYVMGACGAPHRLVVAGGTAAVSTSAALQASLATVCPDASFALSGGQEVAPGDGTATGSAHLFGRELCYAILVDGLAPAGDGAHIHVAPPGQNGPVLATLATPDASGFAAGCLEDRDVDGAALRRATGRSLPATVGTLVDQINQAPAAFYVNVHDAAFADGALRGQLVPPSGLVAALTGRDVVDDANHTRTTDPAPGAATVRLFVPSDTRVCADVTVDRALGSPVTGLAIHTGSVLATGPSVVDLGLATGRTTFSAYRCADGLDTQLVAALLTAPSNHYLSLTTAAHPDGALRAQLAPTVDLRLFGTAENTDDPTTDGAQSPTFGAGDPDGSGAASLIIGDRDANDGQIEVCLDLATAQVDGTLAGDATDGPIQIRAGRVDENGPVLLGFPSASGDPGEVHVCTSAPTDDPGVQEILATDPAALYLQVVTDRYADPGAVRGQLAGDRYAGLSGVAEIGSSGAASAGNLTAVGFTQVDLGADPATMCAWTTVSGLDSQTTGAHIHRGYAGTNGPPLATLFSGAPDLPVFRCVTDASADTVDTVRSTPASLYVNVHSDAFADGAVRGQLQDPRSG